MWIHARHVLEGVEPRKVSSQARIAELTAAERDYGDDRGIESDVGSLTLSGLDLGWGYDSRRCESLGERGNEDVCVRAWFFLTLCFGSCGGRVSRRDQFFD